MKLWQLFSHWQGTRSGNIARIIAGVVASVGLAYVAVNALDWAKVREVFRAIPVATALLSLVPFFLNMALRAYRWRVLLVDQPTSWWQVFLTQNTGIGLNNLSPVRMISEPVQLAMINRRYGVPAPTALATLVAGNVLDIFATAVLLGMGVILVPELRSQASIPLFGAPIMVIVSALVVIAVARGMDSMPVAGKMAFFHRLMVAVNVLRDSPKRLIVSFVATVAHWFLLGLAAWIISDSLGMEQNILTLTALMVAATFFTSAVPSLPGAVGTYEFAVILTLSQVNVDGPSAFAFAVIMHVMVFLPAVAISLFMLSRVGFGTLFRQRSPDTDSEIATEETSTS
jgi:uncharacterized membrane protein YbhN (UPF0104 family)